MSKHKEARVCVWRGGRPPSHSAVISSVDPGGRRALPSPAPSWVPVGRFSTSLCLASSSTKW